MLSEAYLGLGSNLGDRQANIQRGIGLLARVSASVTVSSLYETVPQGFDAQPAFLNAVCRIWTPLDPFALLAHIQQAEAAAGRRRAFANAPRTLDVDILLYGRLVLRAPGLSIPHPRMAERAFVLVPLAELAPGLVHPVLKTTVRELLQRLPNRAGVQRWHARPGALAGYMSG